MGPPAVTTLTVGDEATSTDRIREDVHVHAAVIVAHPCEDSFTQALASHAVAGLRAAGHHVDVLDLYAIGFRAAMSVEERQAYHSDTPILDPMVEEHAAILKRAHTLVFVYPTWWSGLPAVLKGWLERVLVPGVGFVFDERTDKIRPGLTNVRRLIGISTYGSPKAYVKLVNDNGRRTVNRALRISCHPLTRTRWHAMYAIDTATAEQRRQFAERVESKMRALK